MKKQEAINALKSLGLKKDGFSPGTYFNKEIGRKWLGVDVYDDYAVIKKPIKKRVDSVKELISAIRGIEALAR